MSKLTPVKIVIDEADISGYDTAVAYRRFRHQLPDAALGMSLQLSLTPLPVIPAQNKHNGNHIVTTLAALAGPTGCLPPYIEETALVQALSYNHAYAHFIALFQRHLADLLLEADAKYRGHQQNRWQSPELNPFLNSVLAIAGCGSLDENDELQALVIQFASLFADDHRNAASLKAMLEDSFDIPVNVVEFQLHWQSISENERSFLNGEYRLGIDSCIGASSKNAAGRFRVVLGPLSHARFCQFLPDQPLARKLTGLIRLYCGIGLSFDIQLVLDKTEIPFASLPTETRLGYDLWLAIAPPKRHCCDAVFDERSILGTA